jgi:hypothetical protein
MILLYMGGDDVIVAEHITRVKAAGEKQTTVWVVGQSAVDGGFLIDLPFDEVIEIWTALGDDDATT